MDKKVILKKNKEARLRPGHPWIYKSQMDGTRGNPEPGDLVEIHAEHGLVGIGYFNPNSQIIVRILSRRKEPIDKGFIRSKIEKALAYRKRFVSDTNAFRLISSEADGLPGLIVDVYGQTPQSCDAADPSHDGTLVVQFLTMGMEKLKGFVLEALEELTPLTGIYEKSDSASRALEGLPPISGWLRKDCGDEIQIQENGIRYKVRFDGGHKTGFYLDQRENRFLLGRMGFKGSVLDAFCYEGGFGLHLARGGAAEVLGLDIQPEAVARAKENRALNGFSESVVDYRQTNVFDALKEFEKTRKRFDFVILDPPSFLKKKEALEGALAGYKEIILRSMKILNNPGHLAVFSCSFHVNDDLLMWASLSAAIDVRKGLKVLKFLKQSADHPINPFVPETYYLKGFLFEITSL